MVGKQKIRDKCENGHLKNNETAARGPTDVEQHTKKRGRGVETNRQSPTKEEIGEGLQGARQKGSRGREEIIDRRIERDKKGRMNDWVVII